MLAKPLKDEAHFRNSLSGNFAMEGVSKANCNLSLFYKLKTFYFFWCTFAWAASKPLAFDRIISFRYSHCRKSHGGPIALYFKISQNA